MARHHGVDPEIMHLALGGNAPIASGSGTRGAAAHAALALTPKMLSMDTSMTSVPQSSPIVTSGAGAGAGAGASAGGSSTKRRRRRARSSGGHSVRSAPAFTGGYEFGHSPQRTSRTTASTRRRRMVWDREKRDDGRDLLASATMGKVDFEKAAHLDWPVRVRENVGAMGYGPRFRQDRGRGYASRYLLDKPLNSVGPQVRSDWVSPGSIDFGTCTRANKQKQFDVDFNPQVGPGAYKSEPSCLGDQAVSVHRSMPKAIFAEAIREGENFKGRSPGPKYLLPPTVGHKHTKKFSFGAAPKVAPAEARRSPGPKYLVTTENLKSVTGQGVSPNFSFGVAKRRTMVFPQCSPGPVYNIKDPWKKERRRQKGFSFGAAKRPPLQATMGMKFKF